MEDTFLLTLAELKAFVTSKVRLPYQSEKPLGVWVNAQRNAYRQREPSMTRSRPCRTGRGIRMRTRLWRRFRSCMRSCWVWEEKDTFLAKVAELEAFVTRKGRLPRRGEPLGHWVDRQRTDYKNGKPWLTSQRIDALQAVPGLDMGSV